MSTQMYNVKNRSASKVVYRIPELNIRREFAPGESKKLSYDELEKLTYQPGGIELMGGFLQIQSEKVLDALGLEREAEYNMSEEQIVELLQKGSLDAFLDCLDFAPTGVIDLVKTFAVKLPLADYNKRQALKEKTGFDVDAALRNIEAEKSEEPDTAAVKRPGRRTSGDAYKVISREEAPADKTE